MNKIDILIEGYAKVTDAGWVASGTTTLIRSVNGSKNLTPNPLLKGEGGSEEIIIIADPGANRELLLKKLNALRLTVDAIDYVFLTHLHVDHSLLMGIFPNAKVINHEAITTGDKGELVPALIPDTDISVIKTPGHEYAGASLLVPTKDGTVGVVGDVFWFEGEEQVLDVNAPDDFATDMKALKKSRQEVLDLCDWIIPGHGKIMKVVK